MSEHRQERLAEFAGWARAHIRGDEKGEAQIFLDRLFQAFAQKGLLEAGGQAEVRVRKGAEDGGGTSFADCVWKPVVLIEMKKRGADLSRHYRQAFDYWVRLVPGRPQYVVLCNFDEFWVYDFNNQIDSPKDVVRLEDLPTRYGPLAFLFPTKETPTFENDREAVTREAADLLARCFRKLITRGVDRGLAQRFILQTLVALFAEDIELLPRYLMVGLIEECRKPADSYDLIGGLFDAMNSRVAPAGGRYKGVRYFNGGIFAEPARIELQEDELNQLKGAAKSDWSKVSPDIFGAIFQDSMEAEERHAFGAHYTSPVDIMKIVKPTISDPWSGAIESARTEKRLNELLHRLGRLRVLDPACGSGNFLYMAYREMKRLEGRIRERLAGEFPGSQSILDHVNARQFFGLDINSFAIELAKVSMMIGRKLAIDELHIADEPALPLDNLDGNFRVADALITVIGEGAVQTAWPGADVIIGNPPFLGAKLLKPERGVDYVNALRKLYKEVPGMADYCVFRRAHDHLPECVKADPLAGRAGLVGTQNIRNNQSRVGGLDHVVKTGTIVEAVDNQPWSGDANVHVSIVNWLKTRDASLLPKHRRLWFRLATSSTSGKRKSGNAAKAYQLDVREAAVISATLSDQTDTTDVGALRCNTEPQRVFNGQYPRHVGFRLTPEQAARMLAADKRNAEVVHPFLVGAVMLTAGKPDEWVIDFQRRPIIEAQRYALPFAQVQREVLPHLQALAATEKGKTGKSTGQDQNWLQTWWQHFRSRPEMHQRIGTRQRYIACCEVTKRPIFCFVHRDIRADKTLEVFTFDDDYSFGILQSSSHWQWFITKCSKLTERFRYTPESVFDTFPWPQSPTKKQIDAVAGAAREVRRVRAQALAMTTGGLRAVYRTLELPGKHPLKDAHAALDRAVLDAYGFDAKGDLLGQLLELNLAVAEKEKKGEGVTGPGVPGGYGEGGWLVTADCIGP